MAKVSSELDIRVRNWLFRTSLGREWVWTLGLNQKPSALCSACFPFPCTIGGPSELPGREVFSLVDAMSALPGEFARRCAMYQVRTDCPPHPRPALAHSHGTLGVKYGFMPPQGVYSCFITLVLEQQTDGSHGEVGGRGAPEDIYCLYKYSTCQKGWGGERERAFCSKSPDMSCVIWYLFSGILGGKQWDLDG